MRVRKRREPENGERTRWRPCARLGACMRALRGVGRWGASPDVAVGPALAKGQAGAPSTGCGGSCPGALPGRHSLKPPSWVLGGRARAECALVGRARTPLFRARAGAPRCIDAGDSPCRDYASLGCASAAPRIGTVSVDRVLPVVPAWALRSGCGPRLRLRAQ